MEGDYDKPTFYAENPYYVVPEMQTHAILLSDGARGVGLAVIERRSLEAWWSESKQSYLVDHRHTADTAWCVAHVWMLSSFRGRGLATRLLANAFAGFRVLPQAAGWVTPLTNRGLGLVRHFSPAGFWKAGDQPAEIESLEPPYATR